MSRSGRTPDENDRIDSWKEIATFFGRDERTVKRWEKERSLPVHRVPGERGSVFAYTHELNLWLNPGTHNPAAAELAPAESLPAASPSSEPPIQKPRGAVARSLWVLVMALVVVLSLWSLFHLRRSSHNIALGNTIKPVDPEAEEFYLKGRYYWNRRTDGDLKLAVDAFTQAVVHDSEFGKAYAGLAESYDLMPEYGGMPQSEAFPRAIAAAKKALSLDDSLPEAHCALAFGTYYWDWNMPLALAEFQRAIQLDPGNVNAHHWYATALLLIGRTSEARAEIERARELDPASRSILADQAQIGLWTGDDEQSIATLREIERAEPDFLSAPRYLKEYFFDHLKYKEFIAESERAAAISKNPTELAVANAARAGWSAGGEHEMLERMRRVQEQIFDSGQSSGSALAVTCARLGRNYEAVSSLKAAFASRDLMLLPVFGSNPRSPNKVNEVLRGNPEFEQLRKQVEARMSGRG